MTTAELELATTSATTISSGTTMNALVYHGPGNCAWENKPRPMTNRQCGRGDVAKC
jgi:hypothetical protein